MYNYSYIVSYKSKKNYNLQNTQYRKDLLNVFFLEQDNFDALSKHIHTLFHSIHFNSRLWNDILIKSSSRIMSSDKETGFMMLFSFDNFDFIHSILVNYYKTSSWNTNELNILYKNL